MILSFHTKNNLLQKSLNYQEKGLLKIACGTFYPVYSGIIKAKLKKQFFLRD